MSNSAAREHGSLTHDALLRYADMQRAFYQAAGQRDTDGGVVGHYDYHENVPYETNLLYLHGDVRRPIFPDFGARTAFDIACGEGRMVRRMQKIFKKADGADISSVVIDKARARTSQDSDFWVSDGLSAGGAPSGFYDFCYCTISLQHICVFNTRDLILKDICRILKPDGKITLQYAFSKHYPALPVTPVREVSQALATQLFKIDRHHARWFDNKIDASSTNGGCDVVISTSDLPLVRDYFGLYFENVDFWFHDVSIGRGGLGQPRVLPATHPNSHVSDDVHVTHFIFIHCSGKKI